MAFFYDLIARRRDDRPFARQPHERLTHRPIRLEPGDHFLSDVAALRVADQPLRQSGFRQEIRLIHIEAVPRHARLDAEDVQRLASHRVGAVLSQEIPQGFGETRGHDEQRARMAGQWIRKVAKDVPLTRPVSGWMNDQAMRQRLRQRAGASEDVLEKGRTLRALECEGCPVGADIGERDVLGDMVALQGGDDRGEAGTVDEQPVGVGVRQDDEGGQQLAGGGQQRRLAATAWLQRLDVIGEQMVEEAGSIRAPDVNQPPRRPVDEPATFLHRAVGLLKRVGHHAHMIPPPIVPRRRRGVPREVFEDLRMWHESANGVLHNRWGDATIRSHGEETQNTVRVR